MKNIHRLFLAATLTAFALLVQPLFAATSLNSTTLGAAVTSTSAQSIRVASATGFAANNGLFVDGEYMVISGSYVSGLTIPVTRGANGTRSTTHISGQTVLQGPQPAFISYDLTGSCTVATQLYSIYINITNGNIWLCRNVAGAAAGWTGTNLRFLTFNSILITG